MSKKVKVIQAQFPDNSGMTEPKDHLATWCFGL